MNEYGVIPDEETGELLLTIFGMYSAPYRKYSRMVYWMRKFQFMSPWSLPNVMPKDPQVLAEMAIQRVVSDIDPLTGIKGTTKSTFTYTRKNTSGPCCNELPLSVYDTGAELGEVAMDKTWIVSGQSEEQKDMIRKLPKDKAIYVEGGYR